MIKIVPKKYNFKRGFTLIELLVSLAIFVSIMTIMMGSIVTIVHSNQKSNNKSDALDNLNFTLESMSRMIRFGKNYHCGSSGNLNNPQDCSTPSSSFSFTDVNGNLVTYSLSSGVIYRSVNGGALSPLTASNVSIQALNFRVVGSYAYGTDYLQPRVIITLSGQVGSNTRRANFNLQTTVSQRLLDI